VALALPLSMASAQEPQKVLMFVLDGSRDLHLMLTEEVGVMKTMIEEAGYSVEIATAAGTLMEAGDARVQPDLKLTDVDASSYAGFILPCMAPAPGTPVPSEAIALLETAVASGKPIAASRGSVALVAQAGGVVGKEYAYEGEVDLEAEPEFRGGTYRGTGVMRDGNLSTAGICPLASRGLNLPDGTTDLTRAFIESLNAAN
jgi:putative intracellular protease/amidase|tara:strand:+ start:2374 stop:2979 length:606 start_codon:yes stop_codon:yes gene_type:complete